MDGLEQLQKIFESHRKENSLKEFYLSDPVWFPKRFKKREDIEVAAFVSAVFAIGPRYAIIRSLERIFSVLGDTPYESILNLDDSVMSRVLRGHVQFAYKNIVCVDFVQVLAAVREILARHGTLERALRKTVDGDESRVFNMLIGLLEEMKSVSVGRRLGSELTPRAKALLASPKQGSACKRMNMFLRWMTRSDEIDFGYYTWLGKENLVIPLDVNVSRAARKLKLTKRKTDNWKTAVEITDKLKTLDPADPVKYDVPLFLYGIELRKRLYAF